MTEFNPERLLVEYREGVTSTEPIIPRRYTLTHSDVTAKLFLTIGSDFAYDKITKSRDEVLGEWGKQESYFYNVYLYVNGQFGSGMAAVRYQTFVRELPLALKAIRYGDREFFEQYPELDTAPIIIFFQSTNPLFDRVENWGTFSEYKLIKS